MNDDPRALKLPYLLGGRYRLEVELGAGGAGTVYRARDVNTRQLRAVKVLSAEHAAHPQARLRFRAEGESLARIDHPHVVRVYDTGADGGLYWMVMELADGGSLVDWLARYGPMPPRLAVDVARQVAQGLAAVHAARIVHRDVKPANVLVTRDGVCKLADFGIARHHGQGLTRSGLVLGTYAYMPPEQRADSRDVDFRSDVYALGATLLAMLTDRQQADVYRATEEPELLRGVHPALVPIVVRATAYKAADRYATALEVDSALALAEPKLPPLPPSTPPLAIPRMARLLAGGDATPAPPSEALPSDFRPTRAFGRKRTVLVVEDDPAMRRLAQVVLENQEMRVLVSASGPEALKLADTWEGYIDCVLTDLVMPDQSGAQVAEAMRRSRPGVRIVYMTGHTPERLARDGIHAIGGELLGKPFTPDELVASVKRALRDG